MFGQRLLDLLIGAVAVFWAFVMYQQLINSNNAATTRENTIKSIIRNATQFKLTDEYIKEANKVTQSINQQSKLNQQSYSFFTDSNIYETISYQTLMKKSNNLTKTILSKPITGNIKEKDTLLRVLASFSEKNNKKIRQLDH